MVLVIFYRPSLSVAFSINQMYGINPTKQTIYFFTDQLHVSVKYGYHQADHRGEIYYIHNCIGAEISIYTFFSLMWSA